MIAVVDKIIEVFFYILFFVVPLILFPTTSELFEFNKMIVTYICTVAIVGLWILKMIVQKKTIFKKTTLDIPLIIFLASQTLSTLVSVDRRTSILGYYSRFHGGLASSFAYVLLYWAYVANMDKEKTLKALKVMLFSATLVSIYAVSQHFGIDAAIWVQDVQTRVFSTLGQPNWLAAWIVALTPITWALAINSRTKYDQPLAEKFKVKSAKLQLNIQNFWTWFALSNLFFLTLLYTKSRSGILGFAVESLVFWGLLLLITLRKKNVSIKELIKKILILNFALLTVSAAIGTPFTQNVKDLLFKPQETASVTPPKITGPALEVGGTESGSIRKIVWRGAIDIWKNYPILGSGVETFAFSYYNFRPVEHNMVSEWDYLYNKAHNEYLNFAATTGTFGLLAYLILIVTMVFSILKFKVQNAKFKITFENSKLEKQESLHKDNFELLTLHFALLAGLVTILVTNFFGFSVVPVALLFFLYPAFASKLEVQSAKSMVHSEDNLQLEQLSASQKILVFFVLCTMFYALFAIAKYWYADLIYARGKLENDSGNPIAARVTLNMAVKLSPNEAIFWDDLSQASTTIAVRLAEEGNQELANKLAASAVAESGRAVSLSPANVNIKRSRASMLIKLASLDQTYFISARDTLLAAVILAPTEAKLYYNLSLSYLRLGDYDNAIKIMEKTIELRPTYRDAHYALALMYIDKDEKQKAKSELEYILENFNPNDEVVKRELEELGL